MKRSSVMMVIGVLGLGGAGVVAVGMGEDQKNGMGKDGAPACPMPAAKADARFERIKALAGTWESGDGDGDGKPDVTTVYKATAGGTAVMETLFPGTDHEMLTVFHMDGPDVVLTHYCMMGNQPRLKAGAMSNVRDGADGAGVKVAAASISFEYAGGCNIPTRDAAHMDALTMEFTDADHLVNTWASYKDGKSAERVVMTLARKR